MTLLSKYSDVNESHQGQTSMADTNTQRDQNVNPRGDSIIH